MAKIMRNNLELNSPLMRGTCFAFKCNLRRSKLVEREFILGEIFKYCWTNFASDMAPREPQYCFKPDAT